MSSKSKSIEDKISEYRTKFAQRATPQQFSIFMALNNKLGQEYNEKFGEGFKWDNIPFKKRTFRGWLRPMVILSDSLIYGRWTYWLDIKATQQVENKPIPQLNFKYSYDEEFKLAADMIKTCLNPPNIAHYGGYKIFNLFIDWLLFGFGSPLVKALPPIDDTLNEYWYRNFNADLLLMFPSDYWVNIASELYSGKSFNANAFFPTPPQIVDFMTRITFMDDTPEGKERFKYEKFMEPCCGSGTIILYASNHTLRIYAQDIDLLMVKMCNLNCYLYAPWVVEMDDETSALLEKHYQRYTNNVEVAVDVSK